MASTIKVDNVQNQPGTNIVNKCGTTTTIGAGAGETINVCAATVNIGRCGGTVALAAGATQTGFGRTGTVDWITTPKTVTFTAVSGEGYFCNTTAAILTVNLPAGTAGAIVSIQDYNNTFDSNNLTVDPNGSEIINGGTAGGFIDLSTEGLGITFVYIDATVGWRSVQSNEYSTSGTTPTFITATGGTPTTSGDYKIHTFTGPGTFTVCSVGNPTGSDTLDYLVVAGGGSGGKARAGGGGAGGFRVSNGYGLCTPTMSPLASLIALPVTATGYPITVGAGGAATSGPGPGNVGLNSVFAGTTTITSAGGGGGGDDGNTGGDGGSGGGGGESSVGSLIGAGNTPPVSPSQGFPGGASDQAPPTGGPHPASPAPYAGGGGGGASQQGNRGAPGGPGGLGSYIPSTNFGGSNGTAGPVSCAQYFAGGGGGIGCTSSSPGAAVPGGAGGGGTAPSPGTAGDGTINTGGGGSAFGNTGAPGTSGAGGSGIVIIRYKFQ